jgi:hypothetical protein
MMRRGIRFYTAIYICRKCGEMTLRGESNKISNNTFVEYISMKQAEQFKQEKIENERRLENAAA